MPSRLALRLAAIASVCRACTAAQPAYFADGYHGGIYGHYPPTFTQFMVDSLRANPNWKINLEIEPETWDFAQTNTPDAYHAFQELAANQAANGRIEFCNPAYGQSYLWNISGESVIQQLDRGMRKIREHFPNAEFVTYSSEEPCFTSALPGILNSFGFKYAVLKNPNTCWGGYTRAFGGELVNWIGPDGTAISAVPRYEMESLHPGSTWETIANANSTGFVAAAFRAGIKHPVGMCLQDAGWVAGPWLDHVGHYYQPTESTLWRNYFEKVALRPPAVDWRFSQEDVQISLVWGAQILQRLAQEVRCAETQIVMAEKMATLARAFQYAPWPGSTLDQAWRPLLLAQHHDCWIVPYNRRGTNDWAGKVADWTGATSSQSVDVLANSVAALIPETADGTNHYVRVFNTLGEARAGLVDVSLPPGWDPDAATVTGKSHENIPAQSTHDGTGPHLMFQGKAPSLGFNTYRLEKTHRILRPVTPILETNGLFSIETDYYKLTFDSVHGGTISSLIAKQLGGCELVSLTNQYRFNEIRGYFFAHKHFYSTADQPAKIQLLEPGPVRYRMRVSSQIASNSVTQFITLVQGEPRIDCSVRIDWRDNPGIGADFEQFGEFKREQDRKAFYDDRFKLLLLFPLNLPQQEIFKDAPFDVVKSTLADTFFEKWSAIKNNVILNWADAFDPGVNIGLVLLTDHTTSYVHGENFPLGLTLQYAGVGLWGRNYSLSGPTEVHYALLPHAGNWQQARLWTATKAWSEPLIPKVFSAVDGEHESQKSLLSIDGGGWEVPTARCTDGKILVRLFNPSTRESVKTVHYGTTISKVELVQLNGQAIRQLDFRKLPSGDAIFTLALPPFGIGTLQITP